VKTQTEKADAANLDAFLAGESKNPTVNAALPAVYAELRQLASSYLRRERSDHTLQPTALVHESYLRLLNQRTVDWSNRLQFLSIAARMMRRILADYAIARLSQKRGSGEAKLQLDEALDFCDDRAIDVAAVDQALRDLEAMDPRQAQLVELRFFGGLTIEETAEVMAISTATVKREWMTARRWLQRELATS
jgi:RNA polymerase sigma factor (TIGR02999 family)